MAQPATDILAIVAGDIGGTHSRLGLFASKTKVGQDHSDLLYHRVYTNAEFSSFGDVLATFLKETAANASYASFAIAGPIQSHNDAEICQMTNLSWAFDSNDITRTFGFKRVCLLNDFHAVALGVLSLREDEHYWICKKAKATNAPILVLGPGTGLGVALIVFNESNNVQVLSTEAGHSLFSPELERHVALWRYLGETNTSYEWESLLSGSGLECLYRFILCEQSQTNQRYLSASEISDASIKNPESYAASAQHLFLELMAVFTRNLALTTLPYGGIYLAGGILPKILPPLGKSARDNFLATFKRHPTHSGLLTAMPIALALNTDIGVIGARNYLFDLINHKKP